MALIATNHGASPLTRDVPEADGLSAHLHGGDVVQLLLRKETARALVNKVAHHLRSLAPRVSKTLTVVDRGA
jgi:hypothetical protein